MLQGKEKKNFKTFCCLRMCIEIWLVDQSAFTFWHNIDSLPFSICTAFEFHFASRALSCLPVQKSTILGIVS